MGTHTNMDCVILPVLFKDQVQRFQIHLNVCVRVCCMCVMSVCYVYVFVDWITRLYFVYNRLECQ